MTVVTLTGTSASPQTWVPPTDCPPGTTITVEGWGAGSGASGGSASFRAGGAGGGYASMPYVIKGTDVAGIPYTLSAGTAGTGAANPTVGPNTLFGPTLKNLFTNNTMLGAVVGSPGTLPTNWAWLTPNGLTCSVAALGTDTGTGLPYIDLTIAGTTNATSQSDLCFTQNNITTQATPATASLAYNMSAYLSATNQTGLSSSVLFQVNWNTANGSFLSNVNYLILAPVTTTLTQYSGHITAPSTAGCQNVYIRFTYNTGTAINFTLRVAGIQMEQNTAATSIQLTPCSLLGKGGLASSGSTGAAVQDGSLSFGTFVQGGGGGAGKTAGGGGGGSGGKAGAGTTATSGTGGTADGGTVATGVSNIEGGGGATAGTTPATAGSPGGGGGGNTSTGSGSTGGRGQIRITYTPTAYGPRTKPYRQRHMLMR